MSIRIVVCRDFDAISETAAAFVGERIAAVHSTQNRDFVLGLATGNSPTGMYKHIAKAANKGLIDSTRLCSFNLDEYVGLPGSNAQDRAMHPESYSYFMIQELFGVLNRKFSGTKVPPGTLVDQNRLVQELEKNTGSWKESGTGRGRAIVISPDAGGYLGWVRDEVLGGYERAVVDAGGVDLQVIGVGGRGHVAFHEAGIPFEGSSMLLVRLDDNTVDNAVADGHFKSREDCPLYAVSMGVELVFRARTVVLLADGARKIEPVARALLGEVDCDVPLSYCQRYSDGGGELVCFVDRVAGRDLLASKGLLESRGVVFEDRSSLPATTPASELFFSRDPLTGRFV